MLPSDIEYAEGMKIKLEQLNAEITGSAAAVAFIYERGESSPGEIGKHLSDLDLLRTQAWFAGAAVLLLEESKLPERELTGPVRKSGDITDLMIDRARAYPIENLIEAKGGRARCVSPDHLDKKPSMDIRNNFCYCYACGFQADPIKVYMLLKGCTFPEAVRALCI